MGEAASSYPATAPQTNFAAHVREHIMCDSASGKLLTFPTRALPADSVEHWIDQILQTKDHLVEALEFLCNVYNEMLAGMPVRPIDEILAQIETILASDGARGPYTVVATIRTRRPRPAKQPQGALLVFPGSSKRLF
jgi:hypothetical protein